LVTALFPTGIDDIGYFPSFSSADKLKRIDPAVAELIIHIEFIGCPGCSKISIYFDLIVQDPLIQIYILWSGGDPIHKISD